MRCGENLHMRLPALAMALVLATNAFGQPKAESTPGDTGSDLLRTKLETRIRDIADKFDGVMGVAILDRPMAGFFRLTPIAFFRLRAQSKSRSSWSCIVRTRRRAQARKGKRD